MAGTRGGSDQRFQKAHRIVIVIDALRISRVEFFRVHAMKGFGESVIV